MTPCTNSSHQFFTRIDCPTCGKRASDPAGTAFLLTILAAGVFFLTYMAISEYSISNHRMEIIRLEIELAKQEQATRVALTPTALP